MGKISLLDCTLRDGGYVNDWNFGKGVMSSIYNRLVDSGVDIIEIGFLDERRDFDPDKSIQPSTSSFNSIYAQGLRKGPMIVGMIDYGTCSISNIQDCSDTIFDGIRIIFKKPKIDGAIEFAKQLMNKGYKIFLNMVSITSYTDLDILNFVMKVNEIKPYAVSIVDTYGLMHREELMHYFDVLDHNLDKSIGLGYHSHNNFQLAYSNCIEILSKHPNRDIIIDGTIYGMGKSAGNAPLELLAMHLNEYYNKKYDLNQILEAVDNNILNIYHEKYWGYNLLFYVAAMNDCHPNYVSFLLSKSTLSIRSINDILKTIEPEKKLNYDSSYIDNLYFNYQNKEVNDSSVVNQLSACFRNRTLLLLGPGRSIGAEHNTISNYIHNANPIVIAVNMIPYGYQTDYIFITNSKRYNLIYDELSEYCDKIIATSNITCIKESFNYVLNYAKLTEGNSPLVFDNALVLLLNFLSKIPIESVVLAGFDGYKSNQRLNYFDEKMVLAKHKNGSKINKEVSMIIKNKRENMKIVFLTKSIYEDISDEK